MVSPIYPCQSLCQTVQQGCESRMLQYGFTWPEMLKCSRFPLDNDMCIKRPANSEETGSQMGSLSHSRMFSSQINSTPIPKTTTLPTNSPIVYNTTNRSSPIYTTPNSDSKRDCIACTQVPTYENILDNFCRSNTGNKKYQFSYNTLF
jgi:hypothetical protein